ncbi:MAG: magnesium transporter [Candidatus Brachytrichaceae bacterium NZ_4S206]
MKVDHLQEPILLHASRDYTALDAGLTVGEALAQIRERGVAQQIVYFYVVDAEQRLVGVVPTRRLLTAQLNERLADIMVTRVLAVPANATVLEACELFLLHKFLAFPVVDAERRLVGVVNVQLFTSEVFDLGEKARMDDVFQTIGFRVAEIQNASPVRAFRIRLPWLGATLAGGLSCAVLAGFYEMTLAASLTLAFFLTLVLGLGESVAAQSVTVTVQTLHGRPVTAGWLRSALRKELLTALLLGLACGAVVALVAWFWRQNAPVAGVIGGSITLSMTAACLVGVAVPATLHHFKLDPRIASGPVSLALADIFTLLVYFNLAAWLL